MTLSRQFTIVVLFALSLLQAVPALAVITRKQRLELSMVSGIMKKAGESFKTGDFDKAGLQVSEAQKRLTDLVKEGDLQLYREAQTTFSRIARAHALLELEGISLPPFTKPAAPAPTPMATTPAKPVPAPTPTPAGGLSFTKDIAPILVGRCGRCHVTGMRGDFSMADYASLMKGPPEGVVVFPGDPASSRLVEVVESGSMPPGGGKIPAGDIAKLKEWVAKGAKYDGPAPNTQLTAFVQNAGQPTKTPAPEIKKATGRETVSFAKDVASLLVQNCNGCHIDAMRTQGGLRMDTFAQLNRGGDSGSIVSAGNAAASLLIQRLKGEGGAERMPAGGRAPLSDEQIQLISTWINEGATLDGRSPDQPIRVMSQLAWAKDATHDELMEKRMELAKGNWQKGSPDVEARRVETDNFFVMGSVGSKTLEVVAKQAELALSDSTSVVRTPTKSGQPHFKGRSSIFVFPRRYDYSEFGSMIERRSLPQDWREHWRYDGIDSYAAIVVTPADEDELIRSRLVGPLTSLTVAQVGDVPNWLSEGLGRAAAAKKGGKDYAQAKAWDESLPIALSALQKPEQFFKNQLPADQIDLISYGLGKMLLDRAYHAKLNKLFGMINAGAPFDVAFPQTYGGKPEDMMMAFGKWYAANSGRGRR